MQGLTATFITESEKPDRNPVLSDTSLACFRSDTASTHEAKPFEVVDTMADKGKAPVLRHEYTFDCQQRARLPATLVLSFDILRLGMLENVCASWPGPISAAVYLPLVAGNVSNAQTVKDTQALLSELGSRWDCLRSMHCKRTDPDTEHTAGGEAHCRAGCIPTHLRSNALHADHLSSSCLAFMHSVNCLPDLPQCKAIAYDHDVVCLRCMQDA